MKHMFWLLTLAATAGFAYWMWSWRRRWAERKRASDERVASFMAQVMVQPVVNTASLATQKLLLEAAAKAGEAGEPVLSIQLYARLIARYPDSAFAAQARAAVEAQKKKLAKA